MFTEKTEEQLAWDLVKAMVRAKVYLEVAAYRNRRTNELLAELYPLFEASLSGEEVLTIDPEFDSWIRDAIDSIPASTTTVS